MMPNRSYSYSHQVLTCNEINLIQHTNQRSVATLPTVSQMQEATFLLIAKPAWIQSDILQWIPCCCKIYTQWTSTQLA